MVGRRLAHYEIVEKLGEGGMGAVFETRELRFDRVVAIKVLPPGKVSAPQRKRLFGLNHPNIVTIHDIACDHGTNFIPMANVAVKTTTWTNFVLAV